MLLPNIIPLCLLCFQLIESLSPASMRAIATIQNQRARAIANALNMRARAQYNAAVARTRASNLGMLDRRVIRDSSQNLLGQEDYEVNPDTTQLGSEFYNNDFGEEIFIPQWQNNFGHETSYQSGIKSGQSIGESPQYPCMVQDGVGGDLKPEDSPQISVNFNDQDQPFENDNKLDENEDYYRIVEQNGKCPECQAALSQQENEAFPQNYEEITAARSAHPHLRPHAHIHNHIHGIQPLQIPTTQLVAPGVNLNVVQNQNAAVPPQFSTSALQPGYNHHIPMLHEAGSLLHNRGVNVNINPGLINPGQSFGHGTNVYQTQEVQTQNLPLVSGGSRFVTGPGNSVVQTQSVHQGMREAQPLGNMGVAGELKGDADEKLGNFFGASHMSTPQYDEYSDLNGPQNRQGIVRYLANEQILHGKSMPFFKDQNRGDKGGVTPFYHNVGQNSNYDTQLGEKDFENQRLGTFIIDPSQIEPVPPLPQNFAELDEEKKRKSILNILETERRNIKNIFGQIDKSEEYNINNLKHLTGEDDSHGNSPEFYDNIQDEFRNLHKPVHFQDPNQADTPESQFEVQNIDIPEKLGNAQQEEAKWKKEDEQISQMLSKFIENDPDAQKKIGIPSPQDSTLGNLFQLPERRLSEEYLRLARSLNKTKMEELDKLLLKERELINALKKNAKHDEDLMMIGYIGDSLIDDFEKRMKRNNRTKREIGGKTLPFNRLITDPKTRLDIPKTLENLGTVTKTAFEHEKAPLYHVRNMMGSAQDAMMAAIKIPTKNFLIPSQYEIVNVQGQNENLGAINPSLLSNIGDQNSNDGIIDTFNKVGTAFRGSVLSGQEALSHVGEIANHAKSAVHSGRYAAPRMILKQIPYVTREPRKKAVIITPRIFDVAENDGRTDSTLGKSQPDFVRMGHIFDAVGLSNPNAKNVEFEKIVIEPNNFLSDQNLRPSKFFKTFKTMLEDLKVERANEEDFIGSALDTLDDVKYTVGANSLRDLLIKMKQRIGTTLKPDGRLKRNQENSKLQTTPLKDKPPAPIQPPEDKLDERTDNQNNTETQHGTRSSRAVENEVEPNQDNVGASLFPQELIHPFMGQMSEPQIAKTHELSRHEVDKNLGHILGTINPMMFEKMFNESMRIKNETDSPHEMFHHHHDGHSHGYHEVEEELGTSLAIRGQMVKPFMGQASKKMQGDFFGKYGPVEVENSPQFVEFESVPGVQEWGDILHPFQENALEYEE